MEDDLNKNGDDLIKEKRKNNLKKKMEDDLKKNKNDATLSFI